ncbi:MAG: 23S rRNA (pseudouridine(1915)-N(3))-methyltransferase RlmH [Chitinispirillaceae bacterium]|nr:23S rRNA (pseudouridine(1915)-N(3))-methyltransferase RlmH [Chitinispirillaceae bacterium]
MFLPLPKITVIAVGKIKNSALGEMALQYEKRLYKNLDILEIKDKGIKKESETILEVIKKQHYYTIALSEEGKMYTSLGFTKKLSNIKKDKIAFVIGGPEGLSKEVKNNANEIMSLSPMTFTHEMARVLLLEQLYRAYCILNNISYHK